MASYDLRVEPWIPVISKPGSCHTSGFEMLLWRPTRCVRFKTAYRLSSSATTDC